MRCIDQRVPLLLALPDLITILSAQADAGVKRYMDHDIWQEVGKLIAPTSAWDRIN